ncbi:MAG TPA: alpha-glucan family phosphorylase [Chthonomonadaceae bacterium]|nr:alpha-glucan family phosphorylase [Chthonomonadaceae bacterium]
MPTVHTFHVVPALPESLKPLRKLAYNIRWAWDFEAAELFQRLDRDLWEKTTRNPVRMLGSISQQRLQEAAQDESFLAHMERAASSLNSYLSSTNTWYLRNHAAACDPGLRVAYFSMEFGLTECLPIYSGGLGVLAGDHLKSASDLGVPLVGVGLLYQQGYFRQRLNADGWQQERYPKNDFYNLPVLPELGSNGEPVRISVEFPGRTVHAQVWRAEVGRVPLYLLDTNIPVNSAADQNITDALYGGDTEKRLCQELILGIGGLRALQAVGITPTVCHMNEGHAAFLALERVRLLRKEHGVDFWVAQEASAAGNLFTTHTPVPAGFDVFSSDLLHKYFDPMLDELGLSFEDFLGLGRVRSFDKGEQFNMAVLALRHAHHVNAVSQLHASVTRRMVQTMYPGFPEEEVPISGVTNGIHIRSFISPEMAGLLDRYLEGRWTQNAPDPTAWERVDEIPDDELWRVRERRREQLVNFARGRLKTQYEQRNMSEYEIRQTREVLNPNALTIGFARRFATYKRATLILSDPARLVKLLTDTARPVQILLAGKAHPRDDGGKELIRQIQQFARREDVRNRMVFLEDYDIGLARQLVQGVDVWLNTPRMLMEASGTSGMKVLPNGGLNLSIPDGWWAEGYDPRAGWSIGKGEEYADPDYQDRMEALALYELLEKEVVPLFYDRNTEDLPRAWVRRIKSSMKKLCPLYNTHRMVAQYAESFYFPNAARYHRLSKDDLALAQDLVTWKRRMGDGWHDVRVERVTTDDPEAAANPDGVVAAPLSIGDSLAVTAYVRLGAITPDDVTVELMHGVLDSNRQVTNATAKPLKWIAKEGDLHRYEGELPCDRSGLQGFATRVRPTHADAVLPQELSLIAWE